jgi:hypothetical protein
MFGHPRAEVEATIAKTQEEDVVPAKPKEAKAAAPKASGSTSVVGASAPARVSAPAPAVREAAVPAPAPEKPAPRTHASEPKAPREVRHEPRAPRPVREHAPRESVPEKPSLDGAKSLREALSQVTGQKPAEPLSDLKSTLHSVAPAAEAGQAPVHKPAELPKEVLETILAVDENAQKKEADDEYGAWLRDK